jgi:hypothetical protein
VRDENAELGRRIDVDVVDADRVFRDDAKIGQTFEIPAIDDASAKCRPKKGVRAAGGDELRLFWLLTALCDDDVAASERKNPMRFARLIDGAKNEDLGQPSAQSFFSDS